MAVLISAVLPIALVALVGFGVGRTFELDMQTLSRVSIYGFLPALVLTSLAETTLNLESAAAIVAALLINAALLFGVAMAVSRGLKLPKNEQKSLIATTVFANVGNMGLPFVLFALGEAGLERAVVYLVGSSLLIATVFPIVLKGEGIRAGVKVTVRLPVFWAAMTGIALQAANGAFPMPVARGLTLLGEGAIPLALLTLGIQLSRTALVFGRYELLGAGLRLLLSPLLAYSVGSLLGLTGLDLQVVVLQAAMPVAVNSLIWVTEFGGDPVRVARTIVLSTFLSFVSLPTVLWLIQGS
jgi:hypothetical protein